VHVVADGVPFWIELKVSKSNGVNLSPHQVAWNMAYWARGGANFFLVKSQPCGPTRRVSWALSGKPCGPTRAHSLVEGRRTEHH
jgi:hypothetical protein